MSDQTNPTQGPLALVGMLGDKVSDRMKKVLSLYMLGALSWQAGRTIY